MSDDQASSIWTAGRVLNFLSHLTEKKEELSGGGNKGRLKEFLTEVARSMTVDGFPTSPDQATDKLKSMKRRYKEVVDNNSKSGAAPLFWPYFEEMQEIFGRSSDINSDHVVTTTPPDLSRRVSGTNSSCRETTPHRLPAFRIRKTRRLRLEAVTALQKTNKLLEELLDQRKLELAEKNRRHGELLETLNKLVKK